jgi:UPF0176 protein
MSLLFNRLNKEQALEKISQEDFSRKTVSFYRYVIVEDTQQMRDELYKEWQDLGVFGRIYIAREGINAQICVPEPHWEEFIEKLYAYPEFKNMPFKVAVEEPSESFWKLIIKVKHQIVADGLTEDDYDVTDVGQHLKPEEFNQALEKGAICVDMRNQYESRIGKFEGALTPDVDTFREELPMVKNMLKGKEDQKVLLYCTGGIRCEKASAYLKKQGFKDVNQLHGGIINYAHEMAKKGQKSRFVGKNFVFDDRIAEAITDDVLADCDQCGDDCDRYVNCSNAMCNLLFIQCEKCGEQMNHACTPKCRKISLMPIEKQRKLRAGVPHTFKRYKRAVRPSLGKLGLWERLSGLVKGE